jgi:hypothetical protein
MSNLNYTGTEYSLSSLLRQERSGELWRQQADLLSQRHFDGLRQEARLNARVAALGVLSTDEHVVITPNVVEYLDFKVRNIVTEPVL